MSDHTFCRYELSAARAAAKTAGVSVPKRITAIQSTRNLYFVEADGMKGEYVKADCAYDAKARYISNLIDPSLDGTAVCLSVHTL